MRRRDYLYTALLNLIQAIFPPEQPAKAVQPSYEKEIEQLEMTRLHEQYTSQWPQVPYPDERNTDQFATLDLPTYVRQVQQNGDMLHLWNWWNRTPHDNGERFTGQVPIVRKPPHR